MSRTARESDDGAAAVEFALILPVLLLIVFGIIDAGRMLNMQLALTQAAREGVRVTALGGTTAAAQARAIEALFPVTAATATVNRSCPAVPTTTTPPAQVTVARTYNYITPISPIANLLRQPALATPIITGRGRMRCGG